MTTPDRELLRELSALRELLEPMPGDPVPPQPQPRPAPAVTAPPLLDLAQIFDDDSFDPPDPSALPRFMFQDAAAPARTSREALVEALVAERLPRLEAALREHLDALDDDALHAWAEAASETTG